ncbi:Bacterial extracellular solute-binding protein, 3 [Desmophyllum pertusum]|uniref:Bacterial extracellular solute-binding protein, 3 n=1 Tax=Desmophyllum pertusum TaxID=174260 RepID=A0A9X0CHJ9_9CNID|nr:Bacterial extracellular solute-binding protein, 3 [Desmophyllum pertusum]
MLHRARLPTHNNITKYFIFSDVVVASAFRDQNVITLIEGSHTKTSACALSTVTGIPLIRLHGDSRPFDQCENSIQMSAGYRDYAHATLDILNTFGWKNIIVVFDESRAHEAGHFHAISRSSELIMHLVQLSKQGENEDATAPIVKALDQIQHFEAEIILLYIEKENVELMLQQKPCQHRIVNRWVLQGQMPLKLSCYQNMVISLDVLFTHNNSASDKLKNAVGSNYSNTNKEQLALTYDAVQVIIQAVNKERCFSINGSVITPEDTDAMLTCMRKNADYPIHNLEDIVKSSYQVAILASSSTSEFFKSSRYETHKKIWQRIQDGGTQTNDVLGGIKWVRERDELVFITDGPYLRHAANQPPCDLTVVPGLQAAKGLGLALQANDPHTNDFTLAILRLHENDFLASLKRKWWETTNKCPEEKETWVVKGGNRCDTYTRLPSVSHRSQIEAAVVCYEPGLIELVFDSTLYQ